MYPVLRAPRRHGHVSALLATLLLLLPACAGPVPKPPRFVPEPGPGAFQGLGTWLDIYETEAWSSPAATVQRMADMGVSTLYLQASNYGRPTGLVFPGGTGAFLEAAHDLDLHVVGWYFPGWTDTRADTDKIMEAIDFRSERGDGFDGFGIDMEPGLERDPLARTQAALALSRRIRANVGEDYPLAAITPNPMRIAQEIGYWPQFPYRELSQIYDAFLPMDYFGAVTAARNKRGAYRYTLDGIRSIREGADRLSVPIHVIGGLAEDITPPELEGFLKAVERGDAVGFSLYTYSTTGEADWELLSAAAEVMDTVPSSTASSSAGPGSATPSG